MVSTWVRGLRVVKVAVGVVISVGMVTSAGLSATVPTTATSRPSTVPTTATSPRTHDANLTGKWRMTLEMEVGRATPLLELVEKAGKLSGTYTGRYGSSPVDGIVEGRTLAFTVALETTSLEFRGAIKDDGTLAGTATFGELGEVTWTAAREK